jgi:hypothetical protein
MNMTFGYSGKVTLVGFEPATSLICTVVALNTELKYLSNSDHKPPKASNSSECPGYNHRF